MSAATPPPAVPRLRTHPRITLLPTAAILLAACESGTQSPATTDSPGVEIVTSDPFNSAATCRADAEPMLTIGDETGDDEALWFSTIRGMGLLSDGAVAVVDRSSAEVRVFGPDGLHRLSMGRSGEGPGEFSNPWFLWVLPGDTLWVADYRPWRYNVFTRDGQFVRAAQMMPVYPNPSRAGGVLRGGTSINTRTTYNTRTDFSVPDTLIVEAHDADGGLMSTLARVPNRVEGMTTKSEAANFVLTPLFFASAAVDAAGSTIAVGHGRDTEVRIFDEELRLQRVVRWSEPEREVTSAHVSDWRDRYVESLGGRDSDRWGPSAEALTDTERPVADVFPAFSSLKVGTDGRLWVAPYPRPGEEPQRWMGFEPDGTFSCHLERVPVSIYEIGADYVLGVQSNELGVQTVAMYRLGEPQSGSP